jgi:hypothetical protein
MVRLNKQAFRDQLNPHLCIAGKNLVEPRGHTGHVIHDDGSDTHIGWQPPTHTTGKSLPRGFFSIGTLTSF